MPENPVPGCVGSGASTKLILAFPLEEESFKNEYSVCPCILLQGTRSLWVCTIGR